MEIEQNKTIIAVFIDLKRAFETIFREILIEKLEMYGVQENELKWIESYLSNRKHQKNKNERCLLQYSIKQIGNSTRECAGGFVIYHLY
jgi:hypothetical protein